MFRSLMEHYHSREMWFKTLEENISALSQGDYSKIPPIFCVLTKKNTPSKLMAAKALCNALRQMQFEQIIDSERQMRRITSTEWRIDWGGVDVCDLIVPKMDVEEKTAVLVFASFNPSGFMREQAVKMLKEYSGTLPYIILRLNDWVTQVRNAAETAYALRLENPAKGEVLAALPFAEKMRAGSRGNNKQYSQMFITALSHPKNQEDLSAGLRSEDSRIRWICLQGMLFTPQPDYALAFRCLKTEPTFILRKKIFMFLEASDQDMTEASYTMLGDRYYGNRLFALKYLHKVQAADLLTTAKGMLLDKSGGVRGYARTIVRECERDFDFNGFYLNNLRGSTATAILGLGEVGANAAYIEGFLNDARSNVVRACLESLMKLDSDKYRGDIIEKLNDNVLSIVNTAQKLVLSYGSADYSRIREIFFTTPYEHSKIRCAYILFTASKWQRLIYMLEGLKCDVESVRNMSVRAIETWLSQFNNSYAPATQQQRRVIKQLMEDCGERLTDRMLQELLFTVKGD